MATETIEKGAAAVTGGLSKAWKYATGAIKWLAIPTVFIVGTGMFVSTAGAATPVAIAAGEGLGFYAGLASTGATKIAGIAKATTLTTTMATPAAGTAAALPAASGAATVASSAPVANLVPGM